MSPDTGWPVNNDGMPYVLAQLQIRWGNENLRQYNDAFARLRPIFEQTGVVLRNALISQYGGQLYEVWNLWEVDDASHMERARAHLRSQDDYHRAHADLTRVMVSEQIRYLHRLPHDTGTGA